MTDFLLMLARVNLAMSAVIVAIYLFRRPLRGLFGVQFGYALWLLVPVAGLASLLPPRLAPLMPIPVMPQISALEVSALAIPAHIIAPVIPIPVATLDWPALLFAVWVLGVGAMALYLARLQTRFHAAERAGMAGPAVVGFWRPRIVVPAAFGQQFSDTERAAILAHERVHLLRQDARLNALAALLRCICWFNPLIHMGVRGFRTDQELACDAAALRQDISRRDYAQALVKSQVAKASLPLGCLWPDGEHPLIERIALLRRKRPALWRRIAGLGALVLAGSFAGIAAWAAQPHAPAKPEAGYPSDTLTFTEREGKNGPVFYWTIRADRHVVNRDDSSRWLGNVAMQFPYGMARADRATVSNAGTVLLTDNVSLMYGNKLMHASALAFEARSGALTLDGKQMPSGMPKAP